jgi:hypothetical protein
VSVNCEKVWRSSTIEHVSPTFQSDFFHWTIQDIFLLIIIF